MTQDELLNILKNSKPSDEVKVIVVDASFPPLVIDDVEVHKGVIYLVADHADVKASA